MFGWSSRSFWPFIPFYIPASFDKNILERNSFGYWLQLGITLLLTFSIAVFARLLELPFWENPANMLHGEYLFATHDAYHWLAGAENFEFGAGHPMSELARIAADITGTTPAWVSFWIPAIMGGVFAVSIYLWGVAYNAPLSGMCAGIVASLSPTFLARTLLGFYDTDLVVLTFAVLLGLIPVLWLSPWLMTPWELFQRWFVAIRAAYAHKKNKSDTEQPVFQFFLGEQQSSLTFVAQRLQFVGGLELPKESELISQTSKNPVIIKSIFSLPMLIMLMIGGGFGYWMQDWHSLFPYLVRFSALIIPVLILWLGPLGYRQYLLHGAVCHVFPLLLGWWGVVLAIVYAFLLYRYFITEQQSQPHGQKKWYWATPAPSSRWEHYDVFLRTLFSKPVWLLGVWLVVLVLCIDVTVIQNMLASFSSYADRSGDVSSVGTALDDPLVFPAVAQSIIEVQEVSIGDVFSYIYPNSAIIILSIVLFCCGLLFIPGFIWFLPLAALSVLSIRMGGRMTMFGSPVLILSLCLIGGYFIERFIVFTLGRICILEKSVSSAQFWNFFRSGKVTLVGNFASICRYIRFCCAIYCTFVLAWPLILLLPEYIQGPIISRHQAQALEYIRDNTDEASVVWNWWDWGYATHHFSHRTTIADGARHGGPSLYLPAAVYTTADPRFARQLIKYTASVGNSPGEVFKGLSATDAQKLMVALSDKTAPLIKAEGKQYLVVSTELLRVGFWVTKYGSWNFIRKVAPGAIMNIISTPLKYKLDTGLILSQQSDPVQASTIDIFDGKGVLHNVYGYKGAYHFIFDADMGQAEMSSKLKPGSILSDFWLAQNENFFHVVQPKDKMVVDDVFYNTLMVQLLVSSPDDPRILPYFRLVFDNSYTRVYEVR